MALPTPPQIKARIEQNLKRYSAVRERLLEAQAVVDEIRREAAPLIEALVHDDVRTVATAEGGTVTFRRDWRDPTKWIEVEKKPFLKLG
jgi:hypothetical protein